jgi:hypothetical protein
VELADLDQSNIGMRSPSDRTATPAVAPFKASYREVVAILRNIGGRVRAAIPGSDHRSGEVKLISCLT